MEEVVQYIIQLSPAVTALIGVVVALVVGIKKISAANAETVASVKATNKAIIESNQELRAENKELKHQLNKVLKIKETEEE
jgi:Sec-independent protein translocase protein TatA